MTTARSLGGGSAARVAPERAPQYQRRYADTLAVYAMLARELAAVARQRAAGFPEQAKMRFDSATDAVTTHAGFLHEQLDAETARAWIARAQAEVAARQVQPAPPAPKRTRSAAKAERSARNKAAWAARPRGKAAQ